MSQRLYILITRSSLLLIVALVAAPLFDFWRFGRFVPTGSAALPIGAILPAERAAAGVPAGAPTSPSVLDTTMAPPPSLPVAPVTPSPAVRSVESARIGERSPASVAPRSGFEAWTAWGQVDPFWDGYARPARTAANAERESPATEIESAAPAEGLDEVAAAPETAAEPRRARKTSAPHDRGVARPSEPVVETAGEEDSTDGEPAMDHDEAAAPPIDGWVIGVPAEPPAGSDEGRVTPDPSPVPASGSGGTVGPSRSLPHEPRPKPVTFPTAWIDAPTASLGVGESFNVVVRVDSVDQMTSLPFHLMFDAGVLSFVSAQSGTALGGVQPVLLASVNPNRPGDLAVGLSLLEASGSFSGSGNLIVLRFQAIASGQSTLNFSHATLRGPASEAVDTRFTGATVIVR